MISILAALYLGWATTLNRSLFHRVWSVCTSSVVLITELLRQTPSSRGNFLLLVYLVLVGVLCVALSPLPSLFPRKKRLYQSPSLEILWDEGEETRIE